MSAWSEWPEAGGLRHAWRAAAWASLVALLSVSLAGSLFGCYESSEEPVPGVHQPSVSPETYREVRDSIEEEGIRVRGSQQLLMYRLSDQRVRVEGTFEAEDGAQYGSLLLERSEEGWSVVRRR